MTERRIYLYFSQLKVATVMSWSMALKIQFVPPTSHNFLNVSPHCMQFTIKLDEAVHMIFSLNLSYIIFKDAFWQITLSINIQKFEYNCCAVTFQSTVGIGITVSFCLPSEIPE